MAYFPNGAAGMVLEALCDECLPFDHCPIWAMAIEYNYKQCEKGQEHLMAAMNMLITEDGICQMRQFVRPRLIDKARNREALNRPLVFGDQEQIAALKEIDG